MNDFTKEELKGILDALKTIDSNPFIRPENYWPDSLKNKIQSMIDNYCEHEFQIKSFSPHFLMMCDKCDKTFVDGSFPG